MAIAILVTGGTFDKEYNELDGAMIPYMFGSSDGLFNLGSALSFVQVLPAGVFVAMNGRIFNAGEVYKDKQQGIFRAKEAGPPLKGRTTD